MPGQYATLMLALRTSPTLQGVSVLFGEENINAEEPTLGSVCVVPVGGPWLAPGFGFDDAGVDTEAIWQNDEQVDVVCWSAADPNATTPPSPEENADAVNDLVGRVLNAFQYQQMPGGLIYRPVNGSWYDMHGAQNRYGRAYRLSFTVIRPFVSTSYPEATVRLTTVTPIIEGN